MLSASELQALVDAAVVELGATSVKQMGAVIKAVSSVAEGRVKQKLKRRRRGGEREEKGGERRSRGAWGQF